MTHQLHRGADRHVGQGEERAEGITKGVEVGLAALSIAVGDARTSRDLAGAFRAWGSKGTLGRSGPTCWAARPRALLRPRHSAARGPPVGSYSLRGGARCRAWPVRAGNLATGAGAVRPCGGPVSTAIRYTGPRVPATSAGPGLRRARRPTALHPLRPSYLLDRG